MFKTIKKYLTRRVDMPLWEFLLYLLVLSFGLDFVNWLTN